MKNAARSIRFGWLILPILLLVSVGVVWFVMGPGYRTVAGPLTLRAEMQPDEFERRVRAYILENPEVLVEAMERWQARQRTGDAGEVAATLNARAGEVFSDPASPVGGNPEGDVTLVEFFDYNCPYCRQVKPVMIEAEAADPGLRIVYKEFPILGPNSIYAAKAALAAHRQGRYVAFHNALMQVEGPANAARVRAVATKLGLDVERLETDMEDPAIQDVIERNLALAEALRITGTPSLVVGERIVPGALALETVQNLIRAARKER